MLKVIEGHMKSLFSLRNKFYIDIYFIQDLIFAKGFKIQNYKD